MAKKPAAPKKAPAKSKAKPTAAKRATKAPTHAPSGLLWIEEKFCLEYVISQNASRSARNAGYSERSAAELGWRLLRKDHIAARIRQLQSDAAKELNIEHTDLLKRLWDTAVGDVNDIVQVRHIACRYCHGINHEYQWRTKREFDQACEDKLASLAGSNSEALLALGQAMEDGRTIPGMPTDDGGYGYDTNAAPSLDCPECNGEGLTTVNVPDSRDALSHPLYEGVKQTQHGIEVKIADRSKSVDQLARDVSFYNDKVELGITHEILGRAG